MQGEFDREDLADFIVAIFEYVQDKIAELVHITENRDQGSVDTSSTA
jgi:hypothetical protein